MALTAVPLHRRIVWLCLFFLLIGQIMLFSATGVLGLERHGSEFYFVTRQFISAALGVAVLLLFSRVPYQKWGEHSKFFLAIQILLVAATMFSPFGHFAGGAKRWIHVGSLNFQPGELAKITVTLYLAKLLSEHQVSPIPLKRWLKLFAPILLLLVLILKQPDLGTTALLTTISLGLFFIAGTRILYIMSFVGGGGLILALCMVQSEYRRRRLFAFLNPWADPQGSGFQTIQSFLSIHSGGLFGAGIGNGNSKLFYLPEVHTDFIYSLIGEELGFIGAGIVLLLFAYFAYLLFKVAFQAKDSLGCYLAFGIALGLVLQIMVNLGGVTGVLPVKGLPLPFISLGRSALLVNLAMVGILLNIVRQSTIIPSKVSLRGGANPKQP